MVVVAEAAELLLLLLSPVTAETFDLEAEAAAFLALLASSLANLFSYYLCLSRALLASLAFFAL